jgi:tetratricopeptide (TPR) repeat protein
LPTLRYPPRDAEKENRKLCDFIRETCETDDGAAPILLYGEGGIGKSYILLDCWDALLKSGNADCVPLFVPMAELLDGTSDRPVTEYVSEHYLRSPDSESVSGDPQREFKKVLSPPNARLVFIFDGINEYTAVAPKPEEAIGEIRRLCKSERVFVVVSSRSGKELDDTFDIVRKIEVMRLERSRVRAFLAAHELTREIDLTGVSGSNERFLELLSLPIMLSLFTKTYCRDGDAAASASVLGANRVRTDYDMLQLCAENQIRKLGGKPIVKYAAEALLPLLSLETKTERVGKEVVADHAYAVLEKTMSEFYGPLWYTLRGKHEIAVLCQDESACYWNLVHDTVLKNAMYLTEERDGIISWQHELLLEWLMAKGIALESRYEPKRALKEIERLAEPMLGGSDTGKYRMPTALFLFEILEGDETVNGTEAFGALLSSLAVAYDDLSDRDNIRKFATLALKNLEAVGMPSRPRWRYAARLNHVAYALLHAKDEDGAAYAKACFDKAARIFDEDRDNACADAKLENAQLLGNLGAYCFSRKNYDEALRHHEEAFAMRNAVFDENPNHPGRHNLLGNSHSCFALDCFYLGDFEKSFNHHREAIAYRRHASVRPIRLLESYIRCTRTLNELIKIGSENHEEYFRELVSCHRRILEAGNPDAEKFLKRLRGNRQEAANLLGNYRATVGLINKCPEDFSEDGREAVREMAKTADSLRAELSLDGESVQSAIAW